MTIVPRFSAGQHRGERHAALGQPCCDALYLPRQSFGISGFVLCDGAGGSDLVARSAMASARAAWIALMKLRRVIGPRPVDQLMVQFKARLLRRRGRVPLLDHTLLACCWDRRRLLVVQLGDTSLLVHQGGRWSCPIVPAKGVYANQTAFLRRTTQPGEFQLWQSSATTVDAVVAFSDGLESAFLGTSPHGGDGPQANAPLADLVVREHQHRQGGLGYPGWLSQSLGAPALAQLSDDDRSLVIASR